MWRPIHGKTWGFHMSVWMFSMSNIRLPNSRERPNAINCPVYMKVSTMYLITGFRMRVSKRTLIDFRVPAAGQESRINALVNDHESSAEPYFCRSMSPRSVICSEPPVIEAVSLFLIQPGWTHRWKKHELVFGGTPGQERKSANNVVLLRRQ